MSDVQHSVEFEGPDRIVIRLDPGGPIDLSSFADSLAALSRMYERHYRAFASEDSPPKLFISRLESGSVIAEIVPFFMLMGMAIPYMETAVVIGDFTHRLGRALKSFAGEEIVIGDKPSPDDAADLREFVKPLTGRKGACLGVKHARYSKKNGDKETVVEYSFDEAALNRAAVTIDQQMEELNTSLVDVTPSSKIHNEVMLFFQQASRTPGKEIGRTADKAIVPVISSKPLPVYFREGFNDLKDQMVRGESNPLSATFVVDLIVNYVSGEPRGYMVTNVHRVISE